VDGATVSQITATLSQVIDPVKACILEVRRDAASDFIVINVTGQEAGQWKIAEIFFLKILRHDPQAVSRKPLMNHLIVYPETLVQTSLRV
jgi:hypothetical protein